MKLAVFAAVLALSSVASADRSRGQTFVPKGRFLTPPPVEPRPTPIAENGTSPGLIGGLVGGIAMAYVVGRWLASGEAGCGDSNNCQSAREDRSERRIADRRRVQREAALEPRSFLSAVRPKWSRVKQVSVLPGLGVDRVQTGVTLRW